MEILYAPRSSLPAVEYTRVFTANKVLTLQFPYISSIMDRPGYYLMRIDEINSAGQLDTRGVSSVERLLNGKQSFKVIASASFFTGLDCFCTIGPDKKIGHAQKLVHKNCAHVK